VGDSLDAVDELIADAGVGVAEVAVGSRALRCSLGILWKAVSMFRCGLHSNAFRNILQGEH